MINMAEEVKAEAMHKTVNEMVHDLKYAKGMLEAFQENTKELGASISAYVEKTHMQKYVEIVHRMTDEEIDAITLESLEEKFPDHNLMGWSDIDVADIPGGYDYPIEKYHEYLKFFRDRLKEYEDLVKNIEESRKMVENMGKIIRDTRIAQAKNIAKSDSPNAAKAQQFLDDLEAIHHCTNFFEYASENVNRINDADGVYMEKRFHDWSNRNPEFQSILDDASDYHLERLLDTGKAFQIFLRKAIMSYIRYSDKATSRDRTLLQQTLRQMSVYFKLVDDGTLVEEQKQYLDQFHNDMRDLYNTCYEMCTS